MTTTITRCNQCSREKGESNHWFTIGFYHVAAGDYSFVAKPWSAGHAEPEDICSPGCLHTRLDRWIEEMRGRG
jgi:hypothetical protein